MKIGTQRLANQRLIGPKLGAPAETIRWLGAVQAQDYHGAKWAVALRTEGVDDAALDQAFNDGAFLRTHVMRPTWHFVAPEDLRWLLALTGPRVLAVNAHMCRKLELDEAIFRRAHRLLTAALQGGKALTRQALADILESKGIAARGQRLAYVVMHAELKGLLCSGPLQGKQHTYALLEERVPPAPVLDRDEALATLARRYFTSHGPATPHDFAWWSGLTVADARLGLELLRPDVESVTVDGKTYWMVAPLPPPEASDSVIQLLPNYDEHIVAYRDHGPSMDTGALSALRKRTDEPLAVHIVVRDGLVVGGWRRTLKQGAAALEMDLLVKLRRAERAALRKAVEDYGRFLGLPVRLTS